MKRSSGNQTGRKTGEICSIRSLCRAHTLGPANSETSPSHASEPLSAISKIDIKQIMRSMITMTKPSEPEDLKKREKIQNHFWNEVCSIEHISLPKLKNAVKKEFKYEDDRSIQAQIELMQTEARIRIESKVKVWIKAPHASNS
jgi:hypothetical protein